jgi:hypothetical protein
MRKDFTPSEAVAVWMAMENRQGVNQYTKELPSDSDGSIEPRQSASKATGRSTDTLSKAYQVVKASADNPQKYDDLKVEMDV